MQLNRLMQTQGPAATIIIRLIVGGIFLSEGAQKFLYPEALGSGRFARIGIPAPEVMGSFVGCVEIAGGLLLLAGLLTRPTATVMLIVMTVAITSTKGPVLLGRSFAGFALQKLDQYGFLSFVHEARTDLLMLFSLAFLLAVGAGRWSLDAKIARRESQEERK